ncbi:MAG: hypothetical protein ACR2IA_07695 [Pyrinomonadaceae bacterium]
MKKLVSISVFMTTLFIGLFLSTNTPTIYEKLYSQLTQKEVNDLMGKRVINKFNDHNIIGLKYPLGMKFTLEPEGNVKAEIVQNGETGTIVDIKKELLMKEHFWREVMKNCGLLVKWDKKNKDGKDMFSCDNRFTKRLFLQIEGD